jgi:hypothetical protein
MMLNEQALDYQGVSRSDAGAGGGRDFKGRKAEAKYERFKRDCFQPVSKEPRSHFTGVDDFAVVNPAAVRPVAGLLKDADRESRGGHYQATLIRAATADRS